MGTLLPTTPYQRLIEFQNLVEGAGSQASNAANLAAAEENATFSTFDQVLEAFARNWKPIVAASSIGLAIGLAAAFLMKPVYRAKAVVELQIPNEDFLNRRQVDPNSDGGPLQAEPYLQTQLRLLESDGLLWSAAVKSGLMETPEYAPKSRAARLELLHSALTAKLAGQTRIVEITFEGKDRAATSRFANEVVQAYRELVQGRHLAATRQTVTYLETQIAERKQKADAAEERLREYVRRNGLQTIERESAAEIRLRDLQAALALAEANRAQEQSIVEQAEKSTAEAASETADHEALRTYRVRLMDLNAKRAEAVQTLKPTHYKVKQLDAEIAEVEGAYQRERQGLLKRLRGRFDAASRKEALLRAEVTRQNSLVAGQASRGVQYHALKLDFDQQRAAYDEAMKKYQEANSNASVIADNVLVLDTAHEPEAPVRPKKALFVALGLFSGLFIGLIAAFAAETRTKRIEAQARASASLGVPQLGVAPPAWIDAKRGDPRGLNGVAALERYALWNHTHPASAHAEAYRSIVTSLMFAAERSHDGHLRVVITSANNGEGRTTASVAIATAIAETGCRVLLIDANRGKQALHEIFDAPDTTGFFQALANQDGLTAPVFACDVPNLFVMPAGPYKDAMLDVGALRKVLEDLRETYDVILIDAPPVLNHADARWLARVCHGAVLVHDPRITTAKDAEAAITRLRADRIHVFGSVLNQWSANGSGVPAPALKAPVIPEIRIRLRIAR